MNPATPTQSPPPAGSASSYVHPVETSAGLEPPVAVDHADDERPPQTTSQWRMHRRHEARRHTIIDALAGDPAGRFGRQVDRMWDCCRYPSIWDTARGEIALSLSRCKCRMCPLCADARARETSRRTEAMVRGMNAPRFITLTVRAETTSLREQLDRLSLVFRRLRSRPAWKQHVHAAVYALEITLNTATGQWHPHLHIIADGSYFPHGLLKSEWTEVTGDSSVVDIRAVPDRARAARYVATYVTKPADVERWSPAQIQEYAEAIHGRRMLHTTGKLHGTTAEKDSEEETGKCTEQICSLAAIRNAADAADVRAIRAVELMQRMGGFWRRLTLYHEEQRAPELQPLSAAEHAELRTLVIEVSTPSPEPPDSYKPSDPDTARLFPDAIPNAPNAQRFR